MDGLAISSAATGTQAVTLTELLEWRNASGANFIRRSDGVVWVTNDAAVPLTPALEAAIYANQEMLAVFVNSDESGDRNGERPPHVEEMIIDDEFVAELLAM